MRRCCRRPQNEQICLSQNTDFYETVLKAADAAGKKRKKNQKRFANFLPNISLLSLYSDSNKVLIAKFSFSIHFQLVSALSYAFLPFVKQKTFLSL